MASVEFFSALRAEAEAIQQERLFKMAATERVSIRKTKEEKKNLSKLFKNQTLLTFLDDGRVCVARYLFAECDRIEGKQDNQKVLGLSIIHRSSPHLTALNASSHI